MEHFNILCPQVLEVKKPEDIVFSKGKLLVVFADSEDVILDATTLNYLTDSERESFNHKTEYHSYKNEITSHVLLNVILANLLKVSIGELEFGTNELNKPHLEKPDSDLHFNISHSRTKILMAFSHKHEVGIDVEKINKKSKIENLYLKYFHPDEIKFIECSALFKYERFYEIWTRKESFVKALGLSIVDNISKINTLGNHVSLGHKKLLTYSISLSHNYATALSSHYDKYDIVLFRISDVNQFLKMYTEASLICKNKLGKFSIY